MRASLNFTLPDDQVEFDSALAGGKAITTIEQIDNHCRSILKWSEPSSEVQAVVEVIRSMIPADLLEIR
jgi:hypothetical protein